MFQTIYDFIKNIKTPKYIKDLLGQIQSIIISILIQVGECYLKGLQEQIISVETLHPTWSNRQKFEFVFKWGKENIPGVKDSALNLAIEALFSTIKNKAFAKLK
jgi:hypothetical protein